MKKCDDEYRAILKVEKKSLLERVRFVTYTTKYSRPAEWLSVDGFIEHYSKSVVDATREKNSVKISTVNLRRIDIRNYALRQAGEAGITTIHIDGQELKAEAGANDVFLKKTGGQWAVTTFHEFDGSLEKKPFQQGPIDDAFTTNFRLLGAAEKPWHANIHDHLNSVQSEFAALWDKHLRAELPTKKSDRAENRIFVRRPRK